MICKLHFFRPRDGWTLSAVGAVLAISILMSVSTPVYSRSDDSEKPINIEADTAEINDRTGVSIYTGDVVITQGTSVLKGDRVTVTAPSGGIDKVVSVGKPSTYREITDEGKEVYAESLHMEFIKPENRIILLRMAKIEQGGKSFASERIVYHTLDRRVDAGGVVSGNNKSRVKMTIIPDKKSAK